MLLTTADIIMSPAAIRMREREEEMMLPMARPTDTIPMKAGGNLAMMEV